MDMSRVENILRYILGEEATPPVPLSRVEELLIELGRMIEEGKLVNPIVIKGRVDTLADLYAVQNPEPGWLYFVGLETDANLDEYVYSVDNTWDRVGTSTIAVDSALSTESENPVQNKVITMALNRQDDKLDEIEEKFDDLYSIVGIEHYGIKIDKNNSDTEARITYMYDCAGFTPAGMDYTNGVFNHGSWSNAFFMKNNYPAMCNFYGVEQYKLDPNDHSLKEDGTSSDVADVSYNGNAMSVFDCHIWMKFYEDEDYQYLEVSNYKLDDDFKDYPYVRADGSKADKLYYPMYPGYVDSNNKLRSISGVKATSSTTTAQEVTYASNCGTNWSIGDWSHYLWLHSLMLLISKNFNSQTAFGNGNMSGDSSASSFKTNGLLNTSGQFFGYNTDSDSMKAFYQENVYANRWQRLLGFYNNGGTYKIKMVPPYTYDETFEGYTTVPSPTVPSGDYLKDLSFDSSYGLLPKTVGGSSTTYVGDHFYTVNSQTDLLIAGGDCDSGAVCGSWCLSVSLRASHSGWYIGASVYLK